MLFNSMHRTNITAGMLIFAYKDEKIISSTHKSTKRAISIETTQFNKDNMNLSLHVWHKGQMLVAMVTKHFVRSLSMHHIKILEMKLNHILSINTGSSCD